jgi:hypothetical protein
MTRPDVAPTHQADAVLRPALQALLDALDAPGTRWHSHAALLTTTKLTGRALDSALGEALERGWAISKLAAPDTSWAKLYSITSTGNMARRSIEQLRLVA